MKRWPWFGVLALALTACGAAPFPQASAPVPTARPAGTDPCASEQGPRALAPEPPPPPLPRDLPLGALRRRQTPDTGATQSVHITLNARDAMNKVTIRSQHPLPPGPDIDVSALQMPEQIAAPGLRTSAREAFSAWHASGREAQVQARRGAWFDEQLQTCGSIAYACMKKGKDDADVKQGRARAAHADARANLIAILREELPSKNAAEELVLAEALRQSAPSSESLPPKDTLYILTHLRAATRLAPANTELAWHAQYALASFLTETASPDAPSAYAKLATMPSSPEGHVEALFRHAELLGVTNEALEMYATAVKESEALRGPHARMWQLTTQCRRIPTAIALDRDAEALTAASHCSSLSNAVVDDELAPQLAKILDRSDVDPALYALAFPRPLLGKIAFRLGEAAAQRHAKESAAHAFQKAIELSPDAHIQIAAKSALGSLSTAPQSQRPEDRVNALLARCQDELPRSAGAKARFTLNATRTKFLQGSPPFPKFQACIARYGTLYAEDLDGATLDVTFETTR